MTPDEAAVRELSRQRPRSPFLRWSALLFLGMLGSSWLLGDFAISEFLSEKRLRNLSRFLHEIEPFPLQGQGFDAGAAFQWFWSILWDRGWSAATTTLGIAVAAIALAGILGSLFALLAARNLSSPDPFLPTVGKTRPLFRLLSKCSAAAARVVLIFFRAIPEYIWAFLLLALLGPSPWPAVLALALHNTGILGKLGAEVIEDLEPAPVAAVRGVGASRLHVINAALFPLSFSRFLLYFFYRWETCVREATVLGILGIVSLGYWIQDARARNHYDEMVFYVLLGAGLVLIGEISSFLAREYLRRES